MKKKEWNEGLNFVDPNIVEDYVKQKDALRKKNKLRAAYIRFTAVAACFALIIGAVALVPLFKRDDEPAPIAPDAAEQHTPILLDTSVGHEALSGANSQFVVGSSLEDTDGTMYEPVILKSPMFITLKIKMHELNNTHF